MADTAVTFEDMEAFQRVAKYTLVKHTDMHVEMKEEAMDICITAVEKYPNDMEKCTQVSGYRCLIRCSWWFLGRSHAEPLIFR